jgi:hypothetical protein
MHGGFHRSNMKGRCLSRESAPIWRYLPFHLGDERQFLAHGFGTIFGGTGTFNFWQSAAKRGSSL